MAHRLESSSNQVTGDGITNCLRDNEAESWAGGSVAQGHLALNHIDDGVPRSSASTAPNSIPVVLGLNQPVSPGKHRYGLEGVKRKAWCVPCCGGALGWHGRTECACDGGSRGPSQEDGWWGGRFSCSWLYLRDSRLCCSCANNTGGMYLGRRSRES